MVRKRIKFSRKHVQRPNWHEPGSSPGTLTVDPEAASTRIEIFRYNSAECTHMEQGTLADITAAAERARNKPDQITWINVTGLADLTVIERIGELFAIDRLILEDIVQGNQLPKIEELDEFEFVILRKALYEKGFDTRQVSVISGHKYVLTFHERSSTYLDPVRERILKARGKIRKSGADYLSYAIIDCVVDHYFPAVAKFSEMFIELDDRVFTGAGEDFISIVRDLRGALVRFQSITQSTRDVLNRLIANPGTRMAASTRPFFRDCLDHLLQITDQLDSLKLTSSDLMNHYNSHMTQKLNETMKVLTIIATIFIPLTFITSIYGMNFNTEKSPWNMPELNHPFGYPVVLIFMAAITATMLTWFKRNGWLGPNGRQKSSRNDQNSR